MRKKKTIDLLENISPDLNSLLDVIFILLIFTMLSMQVGKISSMELDIPEVENRSVGSGKEESMKIHLTESHSIVIKGISYPVRLTPESSSMDSENMIQINNSSKIPEKDWYVVLEKELGDRAILLSTEKKVPFEDFLFVMEKIKKLEPRSLELGVKEK